MSAEINYGSSLGEFVRLKLVPVCVWAENESKYVETHAFLDEGSNSSLCTFNLLDRLGLQAPPGVCTISTINGDESQPSSRVSLVVRGVSESKSMVGW